MKRLLIAIFLCAIPAVAVAFFGGSRGGGKKLPTGCSDSQIPVYSASTLSWSCGDPGAAAMVYPGAGVPLSTGSAWGTSYTVGTGNNNLVQLNASAQLPAVSGVNLTALNATNIGSGTLDIARVGDGTVTLAKLANMATASILGRTTAGAGVPEVLSKAAVQGLLSVDDLVNLLGVAEGAVDLGTFTGSTIADSQTVKAGLQALETAVELKQDASGAFTDAEAAAWTGANTIATVGTISTGTWNATAIAGDKIDVHSTTAETSVASDDEILIYDTSEGVNRRMTQGNFVAGITASGVKLDIADNGVDESVGITEIATTGTDTNSIFTEPSDNKFLINVGKAWPTASALAANGANCPAGQFPLGVDASGAAESCTALPTTLAGTSNQIAVSASTGAITISIPSSPTLPGTTTGTFSGNLTGNVTGNVTGTVSGNAGTVTTGDAGGDTTTFPMLATSATGSLAPATDAGLSYNAGTNALTATTFVGNLTGNVTGAVTGNASTATTLTDGDKGDFTVSSGSATVDNGAITLAKIANMATASLIGRNTAGTGAPEVLSASTARTLLGLGTVYQYNVGTGANNIPQLSATPGTPDGTKFFRDDGTWVVPIGSGDVTSVGDCTSGACNDETSDGGSYIGLYHASGAARLRNNAGVVEARTAGDAAYAGFRAAAITADSISLNKVSGTAGDVAIVEANSTDTDAAGYRGPASLTANNSYRLQFSNSLPANVNYVMGVSNATPSGTGTPTDPYVYSTGWVDLDSYAALAGATFTGKVNTPAASASANGFNIGQGAACATSGTNGDLCITASGLYATYDGSTVGPFATGAPGFSDVTAGTNTNALVIGNSGSLAATGTGTITATAAPLAGITGAGTGVLTFLATPSSANLASALTGETGTGAAVFGTSPTFTTSLITPQVDFGTTGGRVSAAGGVVTVAGLGNTNNENLTIDFETTANKAKVASGTGVTNVDFSALDLVTTGNIAGGVNRIGSFASPTTSTGTYSLTAANAYNSVIFYNDTDTLALPAAVAGMSVCVYVTGTNLTTIDPDGTDVIVVDGTANAAGDAFTVAGAAGNFVCLVADAANHWITLGAKGTLSAL